MYVVGTKDRPTKFVMPNGEYTEDIMKAMFYINELIAVEDKNNCDEPELHCLYTANVSIDEL